MIQHRCRSQKEGLKTWFQANTRISHMCSTDVILQDVTPFGSALNDRCGDSQTRSFSAKERKSTRVVLTSTRYQQVMSSTETTSGKHSEKLMTSSKPFQEASSKEISVQSSSLMSKALPIWNLWESSQRIESNGSWPSSAAAVIQFASCHSRLKINTWVKREFRVLSPRQRWQAFVWADPPLELS